MKVVVGKMENEYAVVVLPDNKTVEMSKLLLPKHTKEGDVIDISIYEDETIKRQERIQRLIEGV